MYKTIQALLMKNRQRRKQNLNPRENFSLRKNKEKNASSIVAPSSEEKEEIALNLLCDKNIVVSNPKNI